MAQKMVRSANRSVSYPTLAPMARVARPVSTVLSISLAALCVLQVGCGKSEVSETAAASTADVSAVAANVQPASVTISPTDLVSQFLDQVRRGGADSDAGKFLTTKAQSELKRIGRSVQPIGSPAARFDVIQAVTVPQEENAMLVESLWTEPREDGSKLEFQVVWSVEKEAAGWRISGLAILQAGAENPEIVDFENGKLMEELLAEDPPAATDNQSQAAVPSAGLNR